MSSVAISPGQSRIGFLASTIGKKVIMAVTGLILFGFVLGHMAGNLQVFLGPEKLDAYGEALHSMPGLLWTARIGLLIAVILHIWSAVALAALNQKARPVSYTKKESIAASYATRTMMWSGPILAAFIIYHLLHFTFGTPGVHPDFRPGGVYHNVIAGFQVIPVSAFYILSMILLGMHLHHGIWSMVQTMGLNSPKSDPLFRRASAAFALLIVIGNVSIPVAVMSGLLK